MTSSRLHDHEQSDHVRLSLGNARPGSSCPRGRQRVQRLGLEVSVPAEHLPVRVAGDERDLLDGEARLEQPAGAFMA